MIYKRVNPIPMVFNNIDLMIEMMGYLGIQFRNDQYFNPSTMLIWILSFRVIYTEAKRLSQLHRVLVVWDTKFFLTSVSVLNWSKLNGCTITFRNGLVEKAISIGSIDVIDHLLQYEHDGRNVNVYQLSSYLKLATEKGQLKVIMFLMTLITQADYQQVWQYLKRGMINRAIECNQIVILKWLYYWNQDMPNIRELRGYLAEAMLYKRIEIVTWLKSTTSYDLG